MKQIRIVWMQLMIICLLLAMAGCSRDSARAVLLKEEPVDEAEESMDEAGTTPEETPVIQVTCNCQCNCQKNDQQTSEGQQDGVDSGTAADTEAASSQPDGETQQAAQASGTVQVQSAGAQQDASGKVNINTADAALLTSLTGIGEKRAQDIILYRQTYGAFQSIEDIKNVGGIKDGIYDKIKDDITV